MLKKSLIITGAFLAVILMPTVLLASWAGTLEGIRSGAEKITSLRADFVQEKHLKMLVRPLVSKGLFYYRAPDSIRWEYRSPVRSILMVKSGQVKRYVETTDGLTEDRSAALKPVMQFVFQEISLWITGQFDDDPVFNVSLENNRRVLLIPKDDSFSAMIERIELVFSERPGIIDSIIIYEGGDSYSRFKFTNVTVNGRIDETIFSEAR
jgi:outer membrane lipoprotein-sorting protein